MLSVSCYIAKVLYRVTLYIYQILSFCELILLEKGKDLLHFLLVNLSHAIFYFKCSQKISVLGIFLTYS